jgi:hypothetical protein
MDLNSTMMLPNVSGTSPNQSTADGCGSDSAEVRYAKLATLVVLMVAAFAGNVLVCLIVYKNNSMRNTLNYLLVNMAVSDLVIPTLAITTKIVEISTENNEWRVKGHLGNFLCKFIFFVSDVSPIVSILSLLLITFDRFAAVVIPFKATNFPSKLRKYFIAFTWVIAMAFCAPHFYAVKLDDKELFCVMDWTPAFNPIKARGIHAILLMVLFIIIPFTLLIIMYSMILYKMKTRPKELNQTEKGRRRRQISKRNITLLSFAVVVVFALCWGPYFTTLMLANFKWNWDFTRVSCDWDDFLFVVQYLAYSNAAINPLLYFIFLKNYRTGLENMMSSPCLNERGMVKTAGTKMLKNISVKDNGNTVVEIETKL